MARTFNDYLRMGAQPEPTEAQTKALREIEFPWLAEPDQQQGEGQEREPVDWTASLPPQKKV